MNRSPLTPNCDSNYTSYKSFLHNIDIQVLQINISSSIRIAKQYVYQFLINWVRCLNTVFDV